MKALDFYKKYWIVNGKPPVITEETKAWFEKIDNGYTPQIIKGRRTDKLIWVKDERRK